MTFANTSFPHDGGFPGTRRLSLVGRLIDRAVPALQYGRLQLRLPNGDIIERHGSNGGQLMPCCAPTDGEPCGACSQTGKAAFRKATSMATGRHRHSTICLNCSPATTPRCSAPPWSLTTSVLRSRLLHRLRSNSRRGSRHNIAAHYDLGNDFFSPWLDAGMNYSSALYAGETTLEAAQDAKLDRIAALLDLSGGESILEIGCGWGALAERLLRRFNAAALRCHAFDRTAALRPNASSHVILTKGSPTCACWITAMLPENSTASRRSR